MDPRLEDPEVRRAFEREYLCGETTESVGALVESLGLSRSELAERLGVSRARVSQILNNSENLTLKSLADLGWALGISFEFQAKPMVNRQGTPAVDDPPPPLWLTRLNMKPVTRQRDFAARAGARETPQDSPLRVSGRGELRIA